ncbi:MAG: alpha-amylase family glycosyl hydrolase [Planctomycetaceae bacterium]
MSWRKRPVIYEINTWVWLHELGLRYQRPIDLGNVPPEIWDSLASLKIDAVWFMGVWERSPEGIRISLQNRNLVGDFQRALPDFTEKDNVGSPYCVRQYKVDPDLGGPGGLATAREKLAGRGIRLILDFVPNHVATDHPWVFEHPEYFIRGEAEDLQRDPVSFAEAGGRIFACGKDPYFPAWQDVLQVNAFHPGLRQAALSTLLGIAAQCDGVRCDMAMLLMNKVFACTWGGRAGNRPKRDYWPEVIPEVRREFPLFLFLAEAYWDLEWELQQQGFDYCYDKRLYDRLEHESGESVRLHLCADLDFQNKLVRFIENHDEPRAAAAFASLKARAAAVTFATLPGAKLFHEGQLEGRKARLPVFLARRPSEPVDAELQSFYRNLLGLIHQSLFQEGEWSLCHRSGWPDNQSHWNLVAWCWRREEERALIIVNLSGGSSQARVQLPWSELAGRKWRLFDEFTREFFERDGGEMLSPGLFVGLPPWGFHFFRF